MAYLYFIAKRIGFKVLTFRSLLILYIGLAFLRR